MELPRLFKSLQLFSLKKITTLNIIRIFKKYEKAKVVLLQ